jgi:hypothetical protein
MEKLQTLLWILFGIGVFVYRMLQKAKETTAKEAQERPARRAPEGPALPEVTFQEMLKQMQARNAAEKASSDNSAAPAYTLERTPAGRALPQEVAPQARSQERPIARPKSLEAPVTARPMNRAAKSALPATGLPKYVPLPAPAQRAYAPGPQAVEPINQTVRRMLARPADVRAAVVLSEVLQRRHF